MVHADRTVDLIVQTDLPIGAVLAAGELDAVHAEIGMSPAGMIDVFGVDLWQCDEGAAVVWPTDLLGQLGNRGLVGGNCYAADVLGECG